MYKKCKHCNRILSLDNYSKREDRNGYYAFCGDCMKTQNRIPDYPPEKSRGGGILAFPVNLA